MNEAEYKRQFLGDWAPFNDFDSNLNRVRRQPTKITAQELTVCYDRIEQLKKENEALKAAVCIHAREHGGRLGDGISSDDKAVAAFTEYYNPDNWDI